MTPPVTYITVFYDKIHPKTTYYAMFKRVSERQFTNLIDGVSGKEVELRQNEDAPMVKYKILEHRTFQIFTTMENCMYAVFDIEKVKVHKPIFNER